MCSSAWVRPQFWLGKLTCMTCMKACEAYQLIRSGLTEPGLAPWCWFPLMLQNQIFITIPYLLAIFVCSYESHGAFIEKMSLSNYPQIWPFTNYKWLYWLFLWDKKHFINGVSSVRVPCTWYFGHNCMFQFASCLKLPSKWPGAVAACRSTLVESQGLGWCARGLRAGGWRWRGQTRGVLSYVVNDSFNFTNWLSSWLTN